MYMLKVTSSHQYPVFQYNAWVLYGFLTFCTYKFLVQQWGTSLPLTPICWLLCSTPFMIPASCLHWCQLRSPLLHVFPLPRSGLGAAPSTQERESRGADCSSEEGYFNGQDSRQTHTAILGSSLGDLKTRGYVSIPWKLLRQVSVLFYICASVYILWACPPRHGHLPRQVLLQRCWEGLPSGQNAILTWPMVPKVTSRWVKENLSRGGWRKNTSCFVLPPLLGHQLTQTCTFTSWLRPVLPPAQYVRSWLQGK